MAQDTPSRKLDQYIVRFPAGMRDALKLEAAQNGRSLNAEIVQRLERTIAVDAAEYKEALRAAGVEEPGKIFKRPTIEELRNFGETGPMPDEMVELVRATQRVIEFYQLGPSDDDI